MANSFWSDAGSWQDSFLTTYSRAASGLASVDSAGTEALKQIEARVNSQLSALARSFAKATNPSIPGDIYPNNQIEAYPITPGEVIDSKLESINDNDWFAIFLAKDSNYRVQFYASTEAGGDLGLKLWGSWAFLDIYESKGRNPDGSGSLLWADGDNTKPASMLFTPNTSGLYFLKVGRQYPRYLGKYALVVSDETLGTPSYSIKTPAFVREGQTLVSRVETTGVPAGTVIYYSLSGAGIASSDFSKGELTGQITVGEDGTASFAHVLADDRATEGFEELHISLTLNSSRFFPVTPVADIVIFDISTQDTISVSSSSDGNLAALALAGSLKVLDPLTNFKATTSGESAVKTLSQLTAAKPLIEGARKLLDRYTIKDPESTTTRKASDNEAGFIDFTLKTGILKSLTAEVQLAKEVKANAYVKVNPNTGEAFDFTYDPITGLGAQLLDNNKNGLVDTLKIYLQDGAKGDVDGLVNGEIRDPGVLADAPRQSVYRFFKASKGVHLYTSSDAERANVNANQGWGYKDEGVAYDALVTQGKALHRFFNAKASYHFMTTNDEEAKTVKANPAWGFSYEGESFSVSTISQLGMSTPVNRFYRVLDGVGQHFYTASADEANNIIAHPEWGYKSEGVGWYV
jgi:hypothetical protein